MYVLIEPTIIESQKSKMQPDSLMNRPFKWQNMSDIQDDPELLALAIQQKSNVGKFRADSTSQSYTSSWKRFERWCNQKKFDPYTVSPFIISLYLQSILNESNTECPVLNMSAAIAYYRKMVSNEELGKSIEFIYMRETARRTHEKRGITKKRALSDTMLQQLAIKFSSCGNPGYEQDFCMIIVGVGAYGRFSDITTYIEYENLTFEKECVIMQFFKRKQDQSGKKWGPITLECDDDDDDCAYKVLLRFLTKYGISSGPLFRKIRGDGKGFVSNDRMGYSRFLERMRERLRDIGLTEDESKMYATQSLRRSGATIDAAKALSHEHRKFKGQWASAKVVESYVDKPLALEMSKKWKR